MDDRYTLTGKLGGGGMAEVYLARDGVLDRDVALKVLRGQFAHDEEFVGRFRREARSAAGLSHPNIVQVYDQGRAEDGTYYMAIEYVPGGTLKERIVEQGALAPAEAAGIAQKVAEALSVAHERGIVHRDIKPQNVLLTPRGEAKVADFGIARAASSTVVTQTNLILGTAGYMSPEQATGELVEPPSDLYSLGVVLYEMLTGSLPYEADTPLGVAMQHVNAPPQSPREANPEVPKDLDALTVRLLSKDPEDRYPSASALAHDLERIKNGLPITGATPRATSKTRVAPAATPTRSNPTGGTTRRTGRRRRGLLPVFLALVAALLLLTGVVWALSGGLGTGGGGDEVKVPGVEGQQLEEARSTLKDKGFKVGVKREESAADKDGIVLGQSVAGGKTAKKGSRIELTVGQKPSMVAVPDIPYGATPEQARKQLEEVGLKLGNQSETASDKVAAGGVVLQNPLPNAQVEPGTAVDITLSTGPAAAPAPVPETTAPAQSDPTQTDPTQTGPPQTSPSQSDPTQTDPSQPANPDQSAPSEQPAQPEQPAEKTPKPAKEPKPAAGSEIQKEVQQKGKDAKKKAQEAGQ